MPSFKQKSSKKLLTDTKNTVTLDSMHKEKQAEFQYIQSVIIPKLEEELVENKECLKKFNCSNARTISKNRTEEMLDEIYRLRDRNIEIRDSLKKHKAYIKDYYLTNNKYIFSYFEDKKDISDSTKQPTQVNEYEDITSKLKINGTSGPLTKNQRLQTFFKVPIDSDTSICEVGLPSMPNIPENDNHKSREVDVDSETHDSANIVSPGPLNAPIAPNGSYIPKLTNLQHYLRNTGKAIFDYDKYAFQSDVCGWCNNGEMVAVESEGILVCNRCSNFTVYYVESDKPSYKEPPKEASFYAYRRINHFREILAQVQAKETTQIDSSIIASIKNQIRKERITLDQFTDTKAKEILKKLGYNKYYEHIPFIKEKLGIKPPVMSPELEDTLCNLFMETQGPYARFCPDERVNFLNYYYTIYKLCELLGQTQYLPYFPMLKDRDKRIEQDEIWKKICNELNWEFIPTQ
jgi:hypothetical protein